MNSVPRTLLLVQGDPNSQGIGNIFLSEACQHYPKGCLTRFSLVSQGVPQEPADWCGHRAISRPIQSSVLPIASSYYHWKYQLLTAQAQIEELADFARINDIEQIWSVLNSGFMIALTRGLVQRLALPLVSTVWDVPEHFARNYRLDPLTKRVLLDQYASVLRASLRISVASRSMREVFQRRYGVDGIPLIHSVPTERYRTTCDESLPSDQLVIGFAGSLYAKKEWNALLAALRSIDGKLDGRTVRVRFIGQFPHSFAAKAPFVEFLGQRSWSETLDILSGAHVAYLPYWFSSRRAYTVKTSFPSKLSTYVAAGLPVFYHGPRDSSVADFFADYPLGVCCHSLRVEDILESLRHLVNDRDAWLRAADARRSALSDYLGYEVFLSSFAQLLGIERGQLTDLA